MKRKLTQNGLCSSTTNSKRYLRSQHVYVQQSEMFQLCQLSYCLIKNYFLSTSVIVICCRNRHFMISPLSEPLWNYDSWCSLAHKISLTLLIMANLWCVSTCCEWDVFKKYYLEIDEEISIDANAKTKMCYNLNLTKVWLCFKAHTYLCL